MRESSARDWRPITTDVYGTTHKVTGLKPKQDYQFRLRGVTDQGQTDYVYSVPLHRRTGNRYSSFIADLYIIPLIFTGLGWFMFMVFNATFNNIFKRN